MARPKKIGMDYFPHDTDASANVDLEAIIYLYGAEGYAFYFMHLEYIYREGDLKLDISDAETRQILCRKLNISEQKYQEILNSCLKRGLFSKEIYEKEQRLTSAGILKRAEKVLEKRLKMAQKYDEIAAKEVSAPVSDAETMPETRQSKEKKSKENISANADIDYQLIADMYNETCDSFPRLTVLSEKRKQAIRARFRNGYTAEDFRRLFQLAEGSRFLKGGNPRNWHATFDWLISDGNMAKVLDGNYRDNRPATGATEESIFDRIARLE